MRGQKRSSIVLIVAVITGASWLCDACQSQVVPGRQQPPARPDPSRQADIEESSSAQQDAEEELRKGTDLTRRGAFAEALPHLLAARGHVANEYAASFNLALCYVGTNEFAKAAVVLGSLRDGGHDNAVVYNLLAQAQIGNGQHREALESLQKAARLTPQNEKLYLFVADACMDRGEYALGLKVVSLGLQNLTQSSRLHYERAVFLSLLDQFDLGKAEFELARKFGLDTDIGYLAAAHEAFLEGNMTDAIQMARGGLTKAQNPVLLEILGESLIRSGAVPGQPEFGEALSALQRAVVANPSNASSQVALGKLYLMDGRLDDAIAHLEIARRFAPDSASAYANLGKAYQRHGDLERAKAMLAVLANLNQAKAEKIGSAPGDRKASYAGMALDQETHDTPSRP
jgi:tetratricopeptide (TPR) repeat protein